MTSEVDSVCSLHGDFNCVTEREVFKTSVLSEKGWDYTSYLFLKQQGQGWDFLSESMALILREVSEKSMKLMLCSQFVYVPLSSQIDVYGHRGDDKNQRWEPFLWPVIGQVAPAGSSVKMICPIFCKTY